MGLDSRTIGVLVGAAVLRLVVFYTFPEICDLLTTQVEVSTPVSSWKRLQEGLYLYKRGISPYDGGVYHQAPLLLTVADLIPAPLLFTALDLLTAFELLSIANDLTLPSPRFEKLDGTMVAAAYLFNPLTLISCFGRSTNVFTNFTIVQAISNAVSGNVFGAVIALATGTYLTLYPALLIPPLLLMAFQASKKQYTVRAAILPTGYFLAIVAGLIMSTKVLTGSITEFLVSCYGAQITVTDLTPNIGLWWYFFIEIFDAFREFFIGLFWLHLISYVGGLTLRLQKQPLFAIICMLGLFAIFKPYPSVSDVSLYFGFLPLYKHVLPLTQYAFIAGAVLLYATLLGPAFHYIWIYAGSGNANFFYAITLVWSLGLAIVVGDTLFAVLRDEWELERPDMKGKRAVRI